MLESATRLARGDATFCFGGDQRRTYPQDRTEQVSLLETLPRIEVGNLPLLGVGGEHKVFAQQLEDEDRVLKVTLPGVFGRTMDEERMFDQRTFLNVWRLKLRDARPSEYLARWYLLDQLFGLQTRFEGFSQVGKGEPQLVISQPYIGKGQDMPTDEDVEALMLAMSFTKVDGQHVINPENADCTWYRQRDGILITDAFPRNFRIDGDSGAIIPIDLMINIVPSGASKILPPATEPFTLPPPPTSL